MPVHIEKTELLKTCLPFWDTIEDNDRDFILNSAAQKEFKTGEVLHSGSNDCAGLFLIQSGQVRVYIISETGKEVTLYRLFDRDICLFSASCFMRDINFDVFVEAEKETSALLIPTLIYSELNERILAVSQYTNQLVSSRFSDVMWIMEQVLFMSFDKRLALFLLEQVAIQGSNTIHITHEIIAKNMGSAREVVSRMLKYFSDEGIVSLFRGGMKIEDIRKLQKLSV